MVVPNALFFKEKVRMMIEFSLDFSEIKRILCVHPAFAGMVLYPGG